MTVVINGRDDFTLENYRRVSEGQESVAIGPRGRKVMATARANFLRLLESDRTQFIYGVTSSMGPRAKVAIAPEQQRAHAQSSEFRGNFARGFGGDHLDERVVRGIIFARLANFIAGNSKARPVIAERLAALLNGPLPPVPLDGEIGAGEVLPLAHVLSGFPRDDIEEGEANPLANGAPVSAALAADAALRAAPRLEAAEQALALSAAAFGVPADAYAEALAQLWGDTDEAAALAALRRHLSEVPLGRRQAAPMPAAQVPTSYLIVGRVLGQAHRAAAGLTEAARVSLRSVTDNPVYLPPDAAYPLGHVLCTGGFHNAMAYPALNTLAAAWADLTLLTARHLTALRTTDPAAGPGPQLSALVEEARAAAMPTLLPAAVNDAQDDVSSPTFSAYRREATAAECLDSVTALLAGEADRALDAAGPDRPAAQRSAAAPTGTGSGPA
jgi:histidine ammonia-lyase